MWCMKPYSADLRERLLGAIDAGLPQAESARLSGDCPSAIVRWRRAPALAAPRASDLPKRPAQVAAHPDATLGQHCARWKVDQGAPVSAATISRVIYRLSITPRKKSCAPVERDEAARAAWWAETAQLDPTRLVFVEESGTSLRLTSRYGRAPRGQRVVGTLPRNYGPHLTLVTVMGAAGITAAMTMTGPTDGEAWALFVRHIPAPSLHPEQIVLWDNLGVHKQQQIS
jgi:hypothetical protein